MKLIAVCAEASALQFSGQAVRRWGWTGKGFLKAVVSDASAAAGAAF